MAKESLLVNLSDRAVKRELMSQIGGAEKKYINGEEVYKIPHSKTLSVEEFDEYIEKCSAWLSEFCDILTVPIEEFYERPARK